MTYDLMVFARDAAPQERDAFLEWYHMHAPWDEEHDDEGRDIHAPSLRALFLDAIQIYPPMNGRYAPDNEPEDDTVIADYYVSDNLIYMHFSESQADHAYKAIFTLAGKHGVGFFDASSNSAEIWWPDGTGGLRQQEMAG